MSWNWSKFGQAISIKITKLKWLPLKKSRLNTQSLQQLNNLKDNKMQWKNILEQYKTRLILHQHYKLVQIFWVHYLFTGQFNTEDYVTFTNVM